MSSHPYSCSSCGAGIALADVDCQGNSLKSIAEAIRRILVES